MSFGQWIPVPYIDAHQAELLFRHKILKMLKKHGLLSDERINLLLSWKHTGFSIDNSVTVYPSDEPSPLASQTRARPGTFRDYRPDGVCRTGRMVSENRCVSSSQHNRMSYYLNASLLAAVSKQAEENSCPCLHRRLSIRVHW